MLFLTGSQFLDRAKSGGHADQVRRVAFAFDIFDVNCSGDMDQDEIVRFFSMFRRPLLAHVHRAMVRCLSATYQSVTLTNVLQLRYYQTCGFREELQELIEVAASQSFGMYRVCVILSRCVIDRSN